MSIRVKRYARGIFGENTYIIIDDATERSAVIDPGYIDDEVRETIRASERLEFIFLTHAHGDHIAKLPEYRKEFPDAELVADSAEKPLVTSSDVNGSGHITGRKIEDNADIYVNDGDSVMLGETKLSFIHTPGHTPGGMCIYGDGKLFSGDTLFWRSVGRTDFEGGSWEDLRASVQKLFTLPDETIVYTGHGQMTKIGDEKRENPFV